MEIFDELSYVQVRFDPASMKHKTMKGIDSAAKLAMLPQHEIFCVDLTQSERCVVICSSVY
jgi:hypothetical protein